MELKEIIAIGTFTIGFTATVISIVKNTKTNRAKFLSDLYDQINEHAEILNLIQKKLDEGIGNYSFSEKESENLEKLLTFFDKVNYLKEKNLFKKKELEYLIFEIELLNRFKPIQTFIQNVVYTDCIKKIDEDISPKYGDIKPYTGYKELKKYI